MNTESQPTADRNLAADDDRQLRVDLRIETGETFDCPMVGTDERVETARINAVGEECTVDLECADSEGVIRSRGEISDGCLCYVFGDFGCVPHIREIDGRTILATAYVEDRSIVRELVGSLRRRVGGVSLDRLAIVAGSERTEQAAVDLSVFTDKQQEALELAVVRGYFDDEVSLGELADELDISKSALSQRLRSGQAKLVRSVFGE